MRRTRTLSPSFLSQLPPPVAAIEDREALERCLRDLVATARMSFPTVDIEPEEFVAYVAQRVPASGDDAKREESMLDALAALHAGDLYLACGCAKGDPRALEVFEKQFLSQ